MNIYNNYLWINKYKPTVLSDVVGNKEQINKFKDWLLNLSNCKNQSIIISGNQGIGKTLIIKLILEEMNYNIRIINSNDIKDHRFYDDFYNYYNFTNSIYSKLNLNSNNKVALVFDETENITLGSDKKYIVNIYKENNKYKSFPLIFISNNQHTKLLYDLKKSCNEIIFSIPKKEELILLIENICIKENIKIDLDETIEKLLNFSQNDIRRLIILLQELSYHAINNTIDINIMNTFIENSKKKNIFVGLVESSKDIINDYLDYDTIMKLYETEKVLLPLMIHENYIKKLNKNNNDNISDIFNSLINISDSISIGDNIETSIYTNQNWYLQNIHGFFSCVNTSYWINKNNNQNKLNLDEIKFSLDLNKTSLKNINRKNINNLIKIIGYKSIYEILMLNKISNHLINQSKENELIDILNEYNKKITIKDIELCLKIDKTTTFNTLSSKDKKKIGKLKQFKN
jgi:replication factor C subunit 1